MSRIRSRAEITSHQTGDQWAKKHDGWCLFTPAGTLCHGSNGETQSECIAFASELTNGGWHKLKDQGYTVRPVTITEVKNDE